MKRCFALLALTVGTVSIANAETQTNVDDAPQNPLATPWSRPVPTYRFVDPGLTGLDDNGVALAASNVIYLNRCVGGCSLTPGNESAANNRSSILDQASHISAYSGTEASWNAIVSCVKATYAPFNVQIVTDRPTSGTYHMAIVAGRPTEAGMDNNTLGVSPFTCGYINGGISYSFANVVPNDVAEMCWTVAQETAHSWGLDHKFDNKDPMTYLSTGPAMKTFQNTAGSCGEYSARTCQCGGPTMNSYVEIMQTFGPNGPAVPPSVSISAPKNGDTVQAMFPIRADVTDDISVSKAELYIDGTLVSTLTAAPWVWNAPASLQQGGHQVKVVGYDIGNATAESVVSVTYGSKCSDDNPCATATDACVDGRCVVGQGVEGGLGTACVSGDQCASNQCASNADGDKYCVESCDVAANSCPDGFGCIAAGSSGVCWPGAGGGDGGCSTGSSRDGALLIGDGGGDRAVGVDDLDLPAALAKAIRQDVARHLGTGEEHPPASGWWRGQRLE